MNIHRTAIRRGSFVAVSLTLCILCTTSKPAHAAGEHASDIGIGSDADGSGRLVADFPFDEISVVPVTDSGFPGLFTSTDPGFTPVQDEPSEGVFELDIPTTVGLEIVSIDSNVSVQLGASVLSAAGHAAVVGSHDNADPELSALHTHPQFLLSLLTDSTGQFAEGRFTFRFYDDGGLYADSDVHELEISNGYLPPLESPSTADAKCRQAVVQAVRKLSGKVQKRVAACLDAALLESNAGTPEDAFRACDLNPASKRSLAAQLDAEHERNLSRVAKACGPLAESSEPFTESAVSAHLGMASCRAQEVVGAAYAESRAAVEEVLEASTADGTCNAGTCSSGVLAGAEDCASDDECSIEHAIETALPCWKSAVVAEDE